MNSIISRFNFSRSTQSTCRKKRARSRVMGKILLSLGTILLILPPLQASEIKQPDEEFQEQLQRFFSEQASKELSSSIRHEDLFAALEEVVSLEKMTANTDLAAHSFQKLKLLSYIHNNANKLVEKLNAEDQILVVKHVLSLNALNTAGKLKQVISNQSNSYLELIVNVEFAEYYYKQGDWDGVLQILDINLESLPLAQLEKCYFLKAIALQKLKRHRESIDLYDRVSKSSTLYKQAQLNKAVALIRQDWWSDAHGVIEALIATSTPSQQDELINRLYLMIGFSLLRNEYLREARQAFRNVTVDSRYLIKSLFGISLVAIKQKDYAGALNSIKLIQGEQQDNLETYEVNILLPLVYQNLGDYKAAIASYESAIKYYQNKLMEIELLNERQSMLILERFESPSNHQAQKDLALLEQIRKFNITPKLKGDIDKTIRVYKQHIEDTNTIEINKIKQALQSYLSQSKFGLAKLYDDNNE